MSSGTPHGHEDTPRNGASVPKPSLGITVGSVSDGPYEEEDDTEFYEIDIMNFEANQPRGFLDNSISTTKYNVLSFIPLNLFEQLRKISNFYFLTVMILSLIPGASPIAPASAVAPLVLVVAVSGAKDAYEDFKRHRSDKKANEQPVEVFRSGDFIEVLSEDVVVGDILRIKHGEEIKADCVLLNSSLPDGVAYIETANLDGETNAKIKKATDATIRHLGTVEQLTEMCVVSCPQVKSSSRKFFDKLKKPPPFVAEATQHFRDGVELVSSLGQRRQASSERIPNTPDHHSPTPIPVSPKPSSTTTDIHRNGSGVARRGGSFSTVRSNVVSPVQPPAHETTSPFAESHRPSVVAFPGPLDAGVKILCAVPDPDLSNWQGQLIFMPKNRPSSSQSVNPMQGPHEQEMSSRPFHRSSQQLDAEGRRLSDGLLNPNSPMTVSNASSATNRQRDGNASEGGAIDTTFGATSCTSGEEIDLSEPVALGLDQFLFRGAILRNTESALAVVVYAGEETKMFLNLKQKPPKRSQFDREMTVLMAVMFVLTICLVLLFAGLNVWWAKRSAPSVERNGGLTNIGAWYLQFYLEDQGDAERFGFSIITFFILLSYLIPISLFITLELNKGLQVLFISWDEELSHYDPDRAADDGWRSCRPKTSNLSSQLGRVKYIFTDKTGTLTENKMRYVGGFVNSFTYKTSDDPQGLSNYLLQLGYDVPRAFLTKKLEEAKVEAVQRKLKGGVASAEDTIRGRDDAVIRRELTGISTPHVQSPMLSRQGSDHRAAAFEIGQFQPTDVASGNGSINHARTNSGHQAGFHWRTASSQKHQRSLSSASGGVASQQGTPITVVGDSNLVPNSSSNSLTAPHRRVVSFGGVPVDNVESSNDGVAMGEAYRRSVHNTTVFRQLIESKDNPGRRLSQIQARAEHIRGLSLDEGNPFGLEGVKSPHSSQMHSRSPTFGGTKTLATSTNSDGNYTAQTDRAWKQIYNTKLERTTPFLYALGLAACNTVVCFDPSEESQATRKTYEGQSLDEVALVAAAADNNFELVKRTSKQMTFEIMGKCVVYDVIAEMEFTPQRKMMSVILKRNHQAERTEAMERRKYLKEKELSERARQEQEYLKLAKKRNLSKSISTKGLASANSVASLTSHTASAGMDISVKRTLQSNVDLYQSSAEHTRQPTMVSVRSTENLWHSPSLSMMPGTAEEALETAINNANADHSNLFAYLHDDAFYEAHPYLMLTKGADSSVLPNVDMSRARNSDVNLPVLGALAEMANEGLRTLVIANRWLSEQEVQAFLPKLKAAQRSLRDRSGELHDAYAQIEHSFDIVGATAVEDKLQDGVPGTLEFLLQAEVVVWMLTGDKRETAVTIGATSGLVDPQQSDIENLDVGMYPPEEHKSRVRAQLKELEARIAALRVSNKAAKELYEREKDEFYSHKDIAPPSPPKSSESPRILSATTIPSHQEANQDTSSVRRGSLASSQRTFARHSEGEDDIFPPPPLPRTCVMVIDGTTLQAALANDEEGNGPSDRELFFRVGSACRSAICCRLTPLQKADVVRLFQETTGHVALAIGDGANDVSMIQESEIGIGIMGLEGAQAELASDFAIPKFRHLRRLMAVHGRHCLYRDAGTVQFSLVKSLLLVTVLVVFCTRSAFSGQALFTSWLLTALNALFCQIQVLAIGILDKDVDDVVLESFPQLYPEMVSRKSYFNPVQWMWMAGESVLIGGIFYVFCESSLAADDFQSGKFGGFVYVGSLMFYVLCELIGVIAATRFIRSWNWMTTFAIVFGLCTVPIFTVSLGTLSNVGGDSMNNYLPLTIYPRQLYWIHFWGGVVGIATIIVLTRRYIVDFKLAPTSSADIATTDILWKYEEAVQEALGILEAQQSEVDSSNVAAPFAEEEAALNSLITPERIPPSPIGPATVST